jgi:uncharacterized phage protein gp47/JayE
MPITSKGFEETRFEDIVENINSSLITNLSTSFNTSPDTVLGIITSIFSSAISDQEQLSVAISSNLNLNTAQGVFLDRLVSLIGLRRLPKGFSTGIVYAKVSADGKVFPKETSFTGDDGNTYETIVTSTVSSQSCSEISLVPNEQVGLFSLTINKQNFSVNITNTTPLAEISQALVNQINIANSSAYTVIRTGSLITVKSISPFKPIEVFRNSRIDFTIIEGSLAVVSAVSGRINPPINTIKVINNNVSNVISVNNYDVFNVGRDQETDAELRIRHTASVAISGNATIGAIAATLSDISGVSLVRVFPNETETTDSDGRPPHSYECIVEGGLVDEISQAVWDSKPAGVSTYGELTNLVLDYSNRLQSVRWSRPIPVYVNVKVTYSSYTEEALPDNVNEAIKEAVVEYGSSLSLDVDIIPQRFFGPVYRAVDGIGSMTIQVGTSFSPNTISPDKSVFSTNTLAIGQREKADFDTIRVSVVAI